MEEAEMLGIALREARRLGQEEFGDEDAFVLIHSGRSNRRRLAALRFLVALSHKETVAGPDEAGRGCEGRRRRRLRGGR